MPSRADKVGQSLETSLLAGPSFDGFSTARRGAEEQETEAFHPGRQAPVPSRPRHAAPNEQPPVGDEPEAEATMRFTPMRATEPVEDQDATAKFDADATTRLGALSPAEQAERRAAFAQGEAERRANAQAELERLTAERATKDDDDEPPTSPWAAPPRSRL